MRFSGGVKSLALLVARGGEKVCAAGKQGTRGGRSEGWGTTGACGEKAQQPPPGDGVHPAPGIFT